jgi:hypothetical protein
MITIEAMRVAAKVEHDGLAIRVESRAMLADTSLVDSKTKMWHDTIHDNILTRQSNGSNI